MAEPDHGSMYELVREMGPLREPTHEVWGGYTNSSGDCDEPRHLEDCFSRREAEKAAEDWAMGKDRYAFVRVKGSDDDVGNSQVSGDDHG